MFVIGFVAIMLPIKHVHDYQLLNNVKRITLITKSTSNYTNIIEVTSCLSTFGFHYIYHIRVDIRSTFKHQELDILYFYLTNSMPTTLIGFVLS